MALTLWINCSFNIYRVGQKSKLLILSKYVNKIEKIEGCEQIKTATEKTKYCLIFSHEIFYVNCFIFQYSMTESNQCNYC